MAASWTTGVRLGKKRWEWTVLHRVKEAWVVDRKGSIALGEGKGAEAAAVAEGRKVWKGWLVLGMGPGEVLLKVVRLPSGDDEELRGMAEFQADRYSPWPMEEMGMGVERLETDGEESVVALAMARAESVEAAGGPFQAAGALPDGIDLASLGWLRAMRDAGAAPQEGDWVGVRLVPGEGCEAVCARDGVPLWAGALPEVPEEDGGLQAWAEACADELGQTVTSLEAEWGGGAGGVAGSVWAPPELKAAADALSAALGAALGVAVPAVEEGEDAPRASEGLARRFLESADGARMNLAPPAWAEMDAERRFRRGFWRAAGAALLLWAAAVAGFLTLLNVRRGQLEKLEASVLALEEPAAEVRALKAKLLDLSQYADRSTSPLECLRVVAECLPDDIEMNSFVYAKGQDVKVRGDARTAQRVYDFVTALEESGMFPEVRNDGVNTRGDQNAYSLTLVLPGGGEDAEGGAAR